MSYEGFNITFSGKAREGPSAGRDDPLSFPWLLVFPAGGCQSPPQPLGKVGTSLLQQTIVGLDTRTNLEGISKCVGESPLVKVFRVHSGYDRPN